jgi:hypothetical protein
VNEDCLIGPNGEAESFHRFRHAAHQERRVKLIHPRAEVVPRILNGAHAASHEE